MSCIAIKSVIYTYFACYRHIQVNITINGLWYQHIEITVLIVPYSYILDTQMSDLHPAPQSPGQVKTVEDATPVTGETVASEPEIRPTPSQVSTSHAGDLLNLKLPVFTV